MIEFVLKMMDFILRMMDFMLNMMDCILKTTRVAGIFLRLGYFEVSGFTLDQLADAHLTLNDVRDLVGDGPGGVGLDRNGDGVLDREELGRPGAAGVSSDPRHSFFRVCVREIACGYR